MIYLGLTLLLVLLLFQTAKASIIEKTIKSPIKEIEVNIKLSNQFYYSLYRTK